MLDLVIPSTPVLERVISGGQTGGDMGGLIAARNAGFPTGGTAPLTYRTQTGSNFDLRDVYGLTEDQSFSYRPRTIKNVRESCGTLIIAKQMSSPGCLLTQATCKKLKKPVYCIRVSLEGPSGEHLTLIQDAVKEFILDNELRVLNVAGNRESSHPGKSLEKIVVEILQPVLTEIMEMRNAAIA